MSTNQKESTMDTITDEQLAVIGEWFTYHHGFPVAEATMNDLTKRLARADLDANPIDDEPEILHVVYTVPVIAVVNLATESIDRVVVIDEEIGEPTGVTLDDGTAVSKLARARAIALAESDQPWPGWEFGF